MDTILYIHGYNSTGNAWKGQLTKKMFPDCQVLTPTLLYNDTKPDEILESLQRLTTDNDVKMIIGSSMGGYYALCCTAFFHGPIWAVNPVRDIVDTLTKIALPQIQHDKKALPHAKMMLEQYASFDQKVFQTLHPSSQQLNFALSLDDDLLGSHEPLLQMFPQHNQIIWKNQSGHHFARFEELYRELHISLTDAQQA